MEICVKRDVWEPVLTFTRGLHVIMVALLGSRAPVILVIWVM